MRLKRVRRVVAGVACTFAVVSFPQTAHAAAGPGADVIAGTPLPPLPQVQQNGVGLQATPGYVAYNDSQDEYATDLLTVHRLSDGAAVRDLTYSSSDRSFPPKLSGDAVARIVPATNVTPAQFVVDDLVTGQERSRTSVPGGDTIVGVTAAGVVLHRGPYGSGPSSEYVLEPDGSQVPVGAPQSSWGGVSASDATTVVQHVWNRLWAIDVAGGEYHDLGTADSISRAYLTPQRVYWPTENYSSGPTTTTMHWTDRDGANPGSATFVPSVPVRDYVPLGDELLAEVFAGVHFPYLAPIDLSTGQVGAPLVSDVEGAVPVGDGSLALVVADTLAGHLETLAPGQSAPTVVRELQPKYTQAQYISLDGDTVTVDIGDPYSTSPGPLLTNTLGDADWQPMPRPPDPPPSPYVPQTSWTATGDGITWTWHTDAPVITATGTTGTVSAPCAGSDPSRGSGEFLVRGRWALLNCGTQDWIVDLSGRTPSWQVPEPSPTFGVQLSNGFVAVGSFRTVAPGEDYAVLTVYDLSGQHGSRVYGPLHGIYALPRPAFAVDRAGGPRVAYLDGSRQPRLVTLDWLPDYGPDIVAGPAVTATGGSGLVSADIPIQATWSATDDTNGALPGSGVASFDVRYRDGAGSDWTVPDDLQGLTGTSASIPATDGRTTCWSVRARDNDGNVGDWSADRCVTTDRTAPVVGSASAGPSVVAAVTTTTVTFRYAATDATGVASYDVSYRVAARGGALGPITAPASWQRTSATSQKVAVAAGGQACFSVRARDRAGNISASSGWACAAVPVDDRSMSASGGTARHLQLGALGGTSTELTRSGAYVALAGQQGRQLALIALQGPGQGGVDVWAGGVKVGHVNLAYGTWRRVVVLLPARPFRGTVLVNSVTTAPSRIDGVAVLR